MISNATATTPATTTSTPATATASKAGAGKTATATTATAAATKKRGSASSTSAAEGVGADAAGTYVYRRPTILSSAVESALGYAKKWSQEVYTMPVTAGETAADLNLNHVKAAMQARYQVGR